MRVAHVVLILSLVLALTPVGPSVSAPTQSATTIPAPVSGAPRPTIQTMPVHALPGATISVIGQGVDPYPGVRIAWLDEQTTATLQVVELGGNGGYVASVQVPTEAEPGAARICAAVTSTEEAAFECIDFTVDTPVPGSLAGKLPLAAAQNSPAAQGIQRVQAIDARLQLTDRQGFVVASAPVQSDGSFSLANVPPGSYTAGVVGVVPILVQNGSVVIASGQQSTFNPVTFSTSLQKG